MKHTTGDELADRALTLHREALVVDTHSDTTWRFMREDWDFTTRHDEGHMDLPRMRQGGIDAQFFAVCKAASHAQGETDLLKQTLDMIDGVHCAVRRYSGDLALATTADEVRSTVSEGKIAAVIAIEGGYLIEDDLRLLRTYHRLGARAMTLTHGFHTTWADSTDRPERRSQSRPPLNAPKTPQSTDTPNVAMPDRPQPPETAAVTKQEKDADGNSPAATSSPRSAADDSGSDLD